MDGGLKENPEQTYFKFLQFFSITFLQLTINYYKPNYMRLLFHCTHCKDSDKMMTALKTVFWLPLS